MSGFNDGGKTLDERIAYFTRVKCGMPPELLFKKKIRPENRLIRYSQHAAIRAEMRFGVILDQDAAKLIRKKLNDGHYSILAHNEPNKQITANMELPDGTIKFVYDYWVHSIITVLGFIRCEATPEGVFTRYVH